MTSLQRLAVLALAIPMAGCGGPSGGARDTPEQAECRREARNDESVRNLTRTLSLGNNQWIIEEDIRRATERAFRNCLRVRGLPGAGGVEIPPPR